MESPPLLPGRPKVFRDPVHGDIAFERGSFQDLLVKVIDSEPFQRLRGIRQTGVANLVFQGAEHSRFTHSMGVAWVASQMFEAAVRNSGQTLTHEEKEATVLAALLHDIGHGPFSHLLEEVLGKKSFHHEQQTIRLISSEDSPINQILTAYRKSLPQEIVPYIDMSKRKPAKWFHFIVSSQLDADRLDYLARDGYMAGIQTHHFDSRRLISFLSIKDDKLVVDIRARDVVENYLLALDQMYQSVYYHHTVRAASASVKGIINRASDLALEGQSQEKLFPPKGTVEDPFWLLLKNKNNVSLSDYCRLDDLHLWSLFRYWRGVNDKVLADLCTRLATRQFPKTLDLLEMEFQDLKSFEEETRKIWRRKQSELGDSYYIEVDSPIRVGYKRYTTKEGPEDSIHLLNRDGNVLPIEELSRSVVEVIQKKFVAERIVVPPEIADEARALLKRFQK